MGLQIEHIKINIQKDEIIKDLSLSVNTGEFISLLGASGCGKTTLLKSIAGLREIEMGKILLDDTEIQKLPPEKRGTVIVFQDLRLFPHLTVEQNVAFSLNIRKIPVKEQKEIIAALLKEVQLPGFEKRKIREMSGGQMQRVALARALAAAPKILLLDEPFSGLDENLRQEMGTLVRKIQREHQITTIMVTHDKDEALKMSDRIALMEAGEILQYDTPEIIFRQPKSKQVANYFGEVNYISGNVKEEQFYCDFGTYVTTGYTDGEYEMVLRPTEIKVKNAETENKGQNFTVFVFSIRLFC